MLRRLSAELRRLRWKLALAFTVTTTLVITVLLVLLVAVATVVAGSREQQAAQAGEALAQISQLVAPTMASQSIDSARLSILLTVLLERSGMTNTGLNASFTVSAGSIADLSLNESGRTYLLALDTRGRLVGSTLLDHQPLLGRPFDAASLPGLADLLAAEPPQRPFLLDRAARRGIVVRPVMATRRLGTLVYVANDLSEQLIDLPLLLGQFGVAVAWLSVATALIGMVFGLITAHGLTRRLRAIERATADWGRGDFAPRLVDGSADEIGLLSHQLNGVADQIARLIQERQQFATVEERNRLARDLHDSVKQHVFAASMNLGAAQELWHEDAVAAAGLTQRAAAATIQAQRELSDIIHALRPLALERSGLAQALADMAAGWSAQAGIAVTCEILFAGSLAPLVEQAIFRVAQEALANVARHSGATSAALSLRAQASELVLRVSDDGCGFDPGSARAGMGLRSMRERAEAVGARLEIASGAQGTELRLALAL